MQQRAEQTVFTLTWRGSGAPQNYRGNAGLAQLAALLGLTAKSLKCYLSRGGGSHTQTLPSPLTGEPDLATVTRHYPPAKSKPPRGRPPSAATLAKRAAQAERTLDTEAEKFRRPK